jgi:hypothetical protein
MANENGYVIYPDSIGKYELDEAMNYAAERSGEQPSVEYRVEDCDTEKVVARFRNGQEV